MHDRVLQYETLGGKRPFTEWLQSLKDKNIREHILARLDRLSLGNFGDCRWVGEGVHELRFHFGHGYRVYFGIDRLTIVILLCGGDKSNQEADIRRAREHWHDYIRRTR